MFCKYCGANLKEHVNFCSCCGKKLIEVDKTKISNTGKGKAISSMILGIVAIVWAFFVLISIESIPSLVEELTLESPDAILPSLIGGFICLNFISLPTAIPGLALGLSSKYKSGMKTSGIILCSLSLFIALISLLIMIFNAI